MITHAQLQKFIHNLRVLAKEVEDYGVAQVDIEDGELAFMLRKAANLLEGAA